MHRWMSKQQKAGAVAGVTNIRNPVNAANGDGKIGTCVVGIAEQFAAADVIPFHLLTFHAGAMGSVTRTIREKEGGYNDFNP